MSTDPTDAAAVTGCLATLVTGMPAGTRRVAFLESARHADAAASLLADGDVLVAPAEVDVNPMPPGVALLRYDGDLLEPGGDAVFADQYLIDVQDYLASAFVAVVGPTVVRITCPADLDAFLADADLARSTGVFIEQLLHPAVQLADGCTWHGTVAGTSLPRLHVTAGGEIRTGAAGALLGVAGAPLASLLDAARALPQGEHACLEQVAGGGALVAARAARPWLSRYVHAIDALRAVGDGAGCGYRVSGFGGRLVPDLVGEDRPGAPLLLWNEQDHVVHDPGSGRRFRVGADAARLLEVLNVAGPRASGLAAELLGLPAAVAADAVGVVAAGLAGLDVGAPELVGARR